MIFRLLFTVVGRAIPKSGVLALSPPPPLGDQHPNTGASKSRQSLCKPPYPDQKTHFRHSRVCHLLGAPPSALRECPPPSPVKKNKQVVDNNDDIESEDDNDSADAAEAEASPREGDADPSSDAGALFASTPSPQSTPSSGVDQLTDASCQPSVGRGGARGEEDADIPLVLAKGSGGGGGGSGGGDVGGLGDGGSRGGSGGGTRVMAAAATASDGVAAAAILASSHECGVYGTGHGSGGGSGGTGEGGGTDAENSNNPWAGIEWGEGEGESGGAVRRWGRVVQEGDGYGSNANDTMASTGGLETPPPAATGGKAAARERGKFQGQGSSNLEQEGNRVDPMGEGSSQAATPTTTTTSTTTTSGRAKGVAGEPPSRSGSRNKKERRRASGSRAPKALALSSGTSQFFILKCSRSARFALEPRFDVLLVRVRS